MKPSSFIELTSLTSKPRSGFMVILGKSTVDHLRAALGVDEFRAVFIKSSPAYERGTSIAIDLAFTDNHVPASLRVCDYKARPNHRSVQFFDEPSISAQKWGLVTTRVERLSPSYSGYDELLKRNPTTAKALGASDKVVALRFILEYNKMPKPLAYDRLDAKSSKFIKVKAPEVVVESPPEPVTLVLPPEPVAPLKAKMVLNNQPIIQKVVDGRVDLALAISINGEIAREKLVQGLSASQLIEVFDFMESRFGAR